MVKGVGKSPVTTQLPAGIGEVVEIGLTTVVPGACPHKDFLK